MDSETLARYTEQLDKAGYAVVPKDDIVALSVWAMIDDTITDHKSMLERKLAATVVKYSDAVEWVKTHDDTRQANIFTAIFRFIRARRHNGS